MADKKVLIMTDSSCDMPQSFIDENDIKVVAFNIIIDGKTYLDRRDITTVELFKKVDELKELPKTAAIAPSVFIDKFSKYANDYDIVYIGLGTGFSSATSSAMVASKEFDNVYVIDSCNLSAGVGLLLNKACKFRSEGCSAKEINDKILDIIPRVRVQFVIDTLKYLHMGGRCSGVSRILGTALQLKPIIRVVNNQMVVGKKPIGFTRGLNTLLEYYYQDKDNVDPDMMTLTHCLTPKDADYLMKRIKPDCKVKNILVTDSGCVISTHCGPRCIGILYIVNKEEEK